MISQGQTCVNTPILDTLAYPATCLESPVNDLGQAGYVARAMVIAGIGIAALDAAITYDAAKAKGVDGVLRSFAQSPFGPWLLIFVALGLIAFGVLSFVEAKWRRTLGGVPA
jgi:hypothetical protein